MINFKYDPKKYLAFVLDEKSQDLLISKFPFAYEKAYCHHVTLFFAGKEEQFNEVLKNLKSDSQDVHVNYIVNDNDGIQCFIVEFNSEYHRYDGCTFHITHSIRKDKKPSHSNIAIKQVLVPNSWNKDKVTIFDGINITGTIEYINK